MRIIAHNFKDPNSENAMRTAVLDLTVTNGIDCPHNRYQLANFIELEVTSLPANFHQATKITSIGNHRADVIVDAATSGGIYCCVAMMHAKDFGSPLHIHQ